MESSYLNALSYDNMVAVALFFGVALGTWSAISIMWLVDQHEDRKAAAERRRNHGGECSELSGRRSSVINNATTKRV